MKKYYIETYGCVANKVDSEIIKASLESAGWKEVSSPEEADVVLINTCAVKTKTEEHMIARIRKLLPFDPIVIGCLADVNPERIRSLGVKHLFGPRSYEKLGEFLGVEIPSVKAGVPKKREKNLIASVYIAEGCNSACTYCASRLARGRTRSFPLENIVKEIREAVEEGRKEIRLTGQDTGVYGTDTGSSLVELLSEILERVEGDYRIRVGMMSPEHAIRLVDEGYLDLFEDERLYRFFHLPVQSGNDRILRLMGRKYTAGEFYELVRKIRRRFPEALIETDVIVGFPTETWEEFLDTVRLIEELQIDVVNISRFSPRPGTPAARFRGQISSNEKKRRSKYITEVHERVSLERYKPYVGRIERVLVVEEGNRGWNRGRLQNYRLVLVKNGVLGEFQDVRITDLTPRYLVGEAL